MQTEKLEIMPCSSLHLGAELLPKAGTLIQADSFSKIHVVTDEHLASLHLSSLLIGLPAKTSISVIEPGERTKSLDTAALLWREFARAELDRQSLIIALGGGVLIDVVGFAASTFMRGLPFVNCPTTLLSQVDSSVGGKNGLNFLGRKNLIGTITQPLHVLIDVSTLYTLHRREFISGYAEVLKHGLILDEAYFDKAVSVVHSDLSPEDLSHIVERSVELKASIIRKDEHEKGLRKILNFGHTVAHALEELYPNIYTHGEAVSIGMAFETMLSEKAGLLSREATSKIISSIKYCGLPTSLPDDLELSLFLDAMKLDKKNTGKKISWTLLRNIGSAVHDREVEESIVSNLTTSLIRGNSESAEHAR